MNATDKKILAIRAAAGNECSTCPTCGHAPAAPYRRVAEGRIVEGCIDATHSPALVATTASYEWHFRKTAVAVRKNTLASLTR